MNSIPWLTVHKTPIYLLTYHLVNHFPLHQRHVVCVDSSIWFSLYSTQILILENGCLYAVTLHRSTFENGPTVYGNCWPGAKTFCVSCLLLGTRGRNPISSEWFCDIDIVLLPLHHEAAVLITMRWIMLLTGFLNPRTSHYSDGSCSSSVSWEMTIMVVFWGTISVQSVRDWHCWATLTAKQGVWGLEIWPRLGFPRRRHGSSCLLFVWICQKFMMLLWRRGHTCLSLSVALWSWGLKFRVLLRLEFCVILTQTEGLSSVWYWLKWGFEFCVILRLEFHVILTETEAPVPCDTDWDWGCSADCVFGVAGCAVQWPGSAGEPPRGGSLVVTAPQPPELLPHWPGGCRVQTLPLSRHRGHPGHRLEATLWNTGRV